MKYILFIAIVLLTTASGVPAQYRWRVTYPLADARRDKFTAIGASGSHCTASGFIVDSSIKYPTPNTTLMFFRSDDGGHTWRKQNPGWISRIGVGSFPIPRRIQQFDSLTVIVAGDSGLCLRTDDAGNTWRKLPLPSSPKLKDMHFSDASTGTIFTYGLPNVFSTSDGGEHWLSATVPGVFPPYGGAHSFGGGKFRGVSFGAGPLFRTNDYWRSFDSDMVFPLTDSTHYISDCNYTSTGDTLVADGETQDPHDPHHVLHLLMTRSLDGGKHWSILNVPDYPMDFFTSMSSLDSTPVFFGGAGRLNALMSTDHGASWTVDSLRFDSSGFDYKLQVNSTLTGVSATGGGHFVAILGGLVVADPVKESVESYERITVGTHVYPNPATTAVKITSVDANRPITVLDMLGREVYHDVLASDGTLTIDVSHFTRGCYEVILDHYGIKLRVGKVAVIGGN